MLIGDIEVGKFYEVTDGDDKGTIIQVKELGGWWGDTVVCRTAFGEHIPDFDFDSEFLQHIKPYSDTAKIRTAIKRRGYFAFTFNILECECKHIDPDLILKPCPHCGCTDLKLKYKKKKYDKIKYYVVKVKCSNCNAKGNSVRLRCTNYEEDDEAMDELDNSKFEFDIAASWNNVSKS